MRGVFVTGTDTGVGKTYAAAALVRAIAGRGVRVAPMKPIAAGTVKTDHGEANEDTAILARAAGLDAASWADVTPVLLKAAMAPHIAAAREGRTIDLAPVLRARERLAARAEFLVVEGVGGFAVPLADGLDTIDLARALGYPVVMVVGLRLGCLNHALLTAAAVRGAGLPLAGWIANDLDPRMDGADENVAALDARLAAPRLGRLPWSPVANPAASARFLDPAPIL